VAPVQALSFRRTQDIDRLAVAVRLDEAAALFVAGTVNVPRSSRVFRFKSFRRSVTGGVRTSVRLKLSRPGLRAAKRYLDRRGRRLTAKVTVSARDRAGNSRARRLSLRLRD